MSSKPYYVKFETPKELSEAALSILREARQSGKIKKGTNESTKAIERGVAKLVIIAEDVDPPEVVAHLPILCAEQNIPYLYVSSKEEMGPPLGLDVGSAASCILEPGDGKELLERVSTSISKLSK